MLYLQTINLALQTKWAGRLMSSEMDMTVEVLKDDYGPWMDREAHTALVQGTSAYWHSLKQVFPQFLDFFLAKVGDVGSQHPSLREKEEEELHPC